MDKDEALKPALERCCNHDSDCAVHSMPAYPNEPCDCSLAALAQPEQEPVDFASLFREAEEIVQSKPTWKRFIDGTPLANDIAVWMSVFAQDVARRTSPPQRTWVGLTEVDILAASRHWRHAEDFMAGVYWAAGTLKEFNT